MKGCATKKPHSSGRFSLLLALEQTIAVGCATVIGTWFGHVINMPLTFISGLWCAIATVIVLQIEITESFTQAWIRMVGSCAGSIVTLVVASIFGYHFWSFLISIYITVVVVSLINFKQALRIASLTVAVIMITGIAHPTIAPWLNSLSRLTESIIGIVIAIFFVWVFLPLHTRMGSR